MSAPVIAHSGDLSTDIDPTGAWTAAELAGAVPMDVTVMETPAAQSAVTATPSTEPEEPLWVVDPTSPTPDDSQSSPALLSNGLTVAGAAAAVVPRTTGRMFSKKDGKSYSCSASVINSAGRNLVVTAGHCVYTPGYGWHQSISFAPAYYNGSLPYGLWSWATARTFTAWTSSSDYSHDQAFVTFRSLNGRRLADVTGANGLVVGHGTALTGVRVWGWPAGTPYTGAFPMYCDGNASDRSVLNHDAQVPCDMTGGASGGPWLSSRTSAHLGYVYAVTSRRTSSGSPRYLIARPFTSDVASMYALM